MNKPLARTVESYIRKSPTIAYCLRMGIINHSALAQLICNEMKDRRQSAAQMAIGRLSKRIKVSESNEKKIEQQLKRAKMIIRGNMSLFVFNTSAQSSKMYKFDNLISELEDELTIIHGYKRITLIIGTEHVRTVKKLFGQRIHKIFHSLAKIQLILGESAMFTSGFSAYVLSQVASRGINIIEELTCSGEHLLIVDEQDLQSTLDSLRVSQDD
jgi:hypothetical protein